MISWISVSPYPEAAPGIIKGEGGDLTHVSNGRRNCFGRWIGEYKNITEGRSYQFTVNCRPQDIRNEFTNMHALLTWKDAGGADIQRDYIDRCNTASGVRFSRKLPAPEGAAAVSAELCFKWSDTGRVTWSDMAFSEAAQASPRIVRVAAAFTALPGGKEDNLKAVLDAVDYAASQTKPDILCLSEAQLTVGSPFFESAVNVGGPEITRIGDKAKRYNTHIVVGLSLKEDGFYRNAALLFGRSGEVLGIYRKIHLPLAEAESGYTPGDEFGVFDTDFGRIGLMICWDQTYPELSRRLTEKGAEILFNPTFGNSLPQARARAMDNGVFMVVSGVPRDAEPCYIIDPFGDVVASCKSGGTLKQGFCSADLELDRQYKTIWHSVGNCYGEHRPVNANERRSDIL